MKEAKSNLKAEKKMILMVIAKRVLSNQKEFTCQIHLGENHLL